MPWKDDPNYLLGLLGALLISLISAFISLTSRIAKGAGVNLFWIMSELSAAVLVGYLVYDSYPILVKYGAIPEWLTMPVCVAVGSHFGGKVFQWFEFRVKSALSVPDISGSG